MILSMSRGCGSRRALAVSKCSRSAIAASSYAATRRRRQTAAATRSARAVSTGPTGVRASTMSVRFAAHAVLLSPGTTSRVLEMPCVIALRAIRAFPAVVLGPRRRGEPDRTALDCATSAPSSVRSISLVLLLEATLPSKPTSATHRSQRTIAPRRGQLRVLQSGTAAGADSDLHALLEGQKQKSRHGFSVTGSAWTRFQPHPGPVLHAL